MSETFFDANNPPRMIETSASGRQALNDCLSLGYKFDYVGLKICISYPPPNPTRLFAYNLDEFLVATGIVRQHNAGQSERKGTAYSPQPKDEAAPETAEETISRLRAAGRKVIEQRDAWKERAIAAEQTLAQQRARPSGSGSGSDNGRYRKLKNAIAQELHPDKQAQGIERLVKSEIFKVLWNRVEEIDRGA